MSWSIAQPLRRLMSAFRVSHDGRNSARTWRSLVLVGSLSVAVAGCDPLIERRYVNEGAGVDLYTTNSAGQIELLNQYFNFLCDQVGGVGGSCGTYATIVIAGMNDIDQRCDGYLTWLDAKRRDKELVVAELAALNTAIHSVMAITGSSPKSLEILTAAFGLATDTYMNWTSRLLISVEQSTVQSVVYQAQKDYRDTIRSFVIPDRPTAIYVLRNYLRICMPISIEANINLSTKLVINGDSAAARKNLVVRTTTPARPGIIRDVNAPLTPFVPPPPPTPREPSSVIGPYEAKMSDKDMKRALDIVGCAGKNFGPANSPSRQALAKFLKDNGKDPSDHITDGVFFDLRDLKASGKQGNCSA